MGYIDNHLKEIKKITKLRKEYARNRLKFTFSYEYLVSYYIDRLAKVKMSEFLYPGLEDITSLPPHEIEKYFIAPGYCALLFDKKCGGWYVSKCSLSGVTQYSDVHTQADYATPITSGSAKIGEDCYILQNDDFRTPSYNFIEHHAQILAKDTIAIMSDLINESLPLVIRASDDETEQAVREWYDKVLDGDFAVIVAQLEDDIGLRDQNRSSIVMQHIDAYNEHLREFYNEIGVRYTRDKKERMVESEVGGDDQRLLVNTMAELRRRQKDWAAIEKFTTEYHEKHPDAPILKVTPQFAPEFGIIESTLDNPETARDEGDDVESEETEDDNIE